MSSVSYMNTSLRLLLSCVIAASLLPACASSSADSMGATPGGAQDDALANEKVANGEVPRPEDITVEGVLAAHDFPLNAVPCTQELCINSAYAIAPSFELNRSAVFVQLGFDSGIDAATFRRAPLNLSVVVDRSGSMAGEKIASVRAALNKLVDQLSEGDRLSIVLFDHAVEVLLESTPVSDRAAIKALISRITERGSTNMSLGLEYGYKQVTAHAGMPGVADRVMVFTDAIVNTGETDLESFIELASANSAKNIGLTLFGVGIDLNQSLVVPIAKLKGNSYFYLSDAARIATIFDQDFDYLVTPLAYDLRFTLTPAAEYRVSQVYGFTGYPEGSGSVEIAVPTVFLSRGHGAIVVRLEPRTGWPSGASPLASLSLSYQSAGSAEVRTQDVLTNYQGEEALTDNTAFYSQTTVRRAVAFVNAAVGEKQACALYYTGNTTAAVSTLDRTIAMVDREWTALGDLELSEQADILANLRENMNVTPDYTNASTARYYPSRDEPEPVLGCNMASSRDLSARNVGVLGLAVGLLAAARRRRRLAQ